MPRKKSKGRMYFDMDVQNAIIEYNSLDSNENSAERSNLYAKKIHPAFDKLAENIINTFKFSYFSIVAKNYLILHNNNNYKKLKSHMKIDKSLTSKYSTFVSEPLHDDYDDYLEQLICYFEKNIPVMFKKKRDIDIAFSVIELLTKKDEIENFNKKSLYILIREMTNVNTNHITSVINTMKKHYRKVNNYYAKNGEILSTMSGSLNKVFF